MIGRLCNLAFAQTLRQVANDAEILAKIKESFDTLSELLVHNEYLGAIIVAISVHNASIGDWIFDSFLDVRKTH
jgi:hypothetical protein